MSQKQDSNFSVAHQAFDRDLLLAVVETLVPSGHLERAMPAASDLTEFRSLASEEALVIYGPLLDWIDLHSGEDTAWATSARNLLGSAETGRARMRRQLRICSHASFFFTLGPRFSFDLRAKIFFLTLGLQILHIPAFGFNCLHILAIGFVSFLF